MPRSPSLHSRAASARRHGIHAGPHGKLVLIGGAEDKSGQCAVLKEFVRQAGGRKSSIVLVTVASTDPQTGPRYTKVFKRLGAGSIHVVDLPDREGGQSKKAVAEIHSSSAVFFTGGNQAALSTFLGGTELDAAIHERFMEGIVVGGTSAGAAVMSSSMIMEGTSRINPRKNAVKLAPGVQFLMGAVIDTHFSERGRHGRLLTAVAESPHDLGIGIDEDTAAIVHKGQFEVIGRGAITIVDIGAATYDNLSQLRKEESIGLYDVKIHVLPAGHRFDLGRRAPIPRRPGSPVKASRL